MATPYATFTLPTVGSTQDEARIRLAEVERTGAHDAALVVSTRQTEGRGRRGRRWEEAPLAMYSSFAFRPRWPQETWPRLSLVTGLAVRSAIASVIGVLVDLKWPNDLLVGDDKCGGILTESEGGVVVIGCGVNLWWPAPPMGVAAVCADDPGGGGVTLATGLATSWAAEVVAVAAGSAEMWGRDSFRSVCTTIGIDITWEPDGRGRAIDIAPDGGLIVETPDGVETLGSGEVRTVRRATVAAETGGSETAAAMEADTSERPEG